MKNYFGALLAVTAAFLCTESFKCACAESGTGLPSANVAVILEAQQGDKWIN